VHDHYSVYEWFEGRSTMLLLGQPVKRFSFNQRCAFLMVFYFYWAFILLGKIYHFKQNISCSAECPRNMVNNVPQAETNGPPGMEPEEHFIQTTFIYRDLSGD
jgi:hypothetical protein